MDVFARKSGIVKFLIRTNSGGMNDEPREDRYIINNGMSTSFVCQGWFFDILGRY